MHGDTTTALVSSLLALYACIAIEHALIWDKYSSCLEKMNRRVTDDLADLCLYQRKSSSQFIKERSF